MIRSKSDYRQYLESDRIALGQVRGVRSLLFDDVWRFQRLLRRLEYLHNCRGGLWSAVIRRWVSARYRRLGRLLGFTIPINVFGPGLSIAHPGTIVVNENARIGANCRLHVCVNIGAAIDDGNAAPTIGDDCYIGPGAKLYGAIVLGDNVAIGANAVVNRNFESSSITIAGVPARKISDRGTLSYRSVHRLKPGPS